MLKKISIVLAVIVAAVLITGGIAFTTVFVQASQRAEGNPKAKFLSLVRANVDSERWSDDQLVDVATATCSALESGHSIREITYLIATNDAVDSSEIEPISSVIGYGISAYCPELGDKKMKEYSGHSG